MDEDFEFDPAKSAANRDKHGIDFAEAQALWKGPALDQSLAYAGEPRRLLTGRIGGRFWSAVYTLRGVTVRLISVRRARKDEVEDYGRNYPEQRDGDER